PWVRIPPSPPFYLKMRIYFLIFIFILISIYFLMHYYIFFRITHDLSIKENSKKMIILIFILGGISFILGEILTRQFSLNAIFLIYLSLIWLGAIAITFSIFLVSEIFRLFFPYYKNMITLISLIISFIAITFSLINASTPPRIKELKLKYKNLPFFLNGFRIVQLSDVHLGIMTGNSWIEKLVQRVNSLNPDLILITGDLIDSDINKINGIVDALKRLKAKYGVFAVTGNHEFYAGVEKFYELSEKAGIRILRNEKFGLNENIEIIGVDDDTSKSFRKEKENPEELFKNVSTDKFTIFLYHKPKYFELAVKAGVDLQLSGHTHAGQIPPMDLIVFLTYKYPYGLHKLEDSYIYTTSGTRFWGPPMRLFSSSEIVEIVLSSSE
ncbi:MAG: metallophosphoesterase, partial [Candidatus Aminicenantia bacterium]